MSAAAPPPRCCITDRRSVEFSEAAVLQAISATPAIASSLGLPPSRPETIRFLPGTNTVEVGYGAGAQPGVVAVGASSLGALLLAYCIRARIALPRGATKSVCVIDDAVVLQLRLELGALPVLPAPETRKPGKPPERQQRSMSWTDRPVESA